jgi:hypothetical protein
MPRRRARTTNRRPRDERRLRVRGLRHDPPDPRRLSRAFIGLALARAEAEARAQQASEAEATRDDDHSAQKDGGHDGIS